MSAAEQAAEYKALLESGLSDAEARGAVWPDSTIEEETELANSIYEEWITCPSECAATNHPGHEHGWECDELTKPEVQP